MSTAPAVPDFDRAIEMPPMIPPTASEVRALLDQWWGRIQRVVIELFKARNSYGIVNSFAVAANESNLRDEIEEMIMGAAQAHWEEDAPLPQTYRVMIFLDNPKGLKTPPRKSCHFSLGGATGEVYDAYDPGRIDDYLIKHNEALHGRVMELSGVIKDFGTAVTDRLTDAFKAEREANREIAEARVEMKRLEVESASSTKELDQKERLLKLLEPAAEHVSEALGVKAAEVFAGDSSDDEDDDEDGDEKKPRKLTALASRKDHDDDEGDDEAPPKVSTGAGKLARLKQEHPHAYTARRFGDTIRSRQWFAIAQVLTKKQISLLNKITEADTNEQVLDGFGKFRKLLKDDQLNELKKILEKPQLAMITQLFVASTTAEADKPDDKS